MKLEFRRITPEEATLRRWIGVGREYALPSGRIIVRLFDDIQAGFDRLHSAYGPIEVRQADRFLEVLTGVPAFPDVLTNETEWFWTYLNSKLSEELVNLFRYLGPDIGEQVDMLPVELTGERDDKSERFYGRLPLRLLEVWKSLRFSPQSNPFPETFPISLPFIVGSVTVSAGLIDQLSEGDVLLPTDCLINTLGEGFLSLEHHLFQFELEPDPDNSHKYKLQITFQNGQETMTQHEEYSDLETDGESVEGEVMQTSEEKGFNDLPIELTIRCGNLSLTLGELQSLDAGSTLMVDHVTPGEALLCHGNYLVAKGELVNVNGSLGLQIKSMLRAGSH